MHKNWSYFCLITSLSFICVATISPFNFVVFHDVSWQLISQKFKHVSDLKDYWQNILLFIPLGFSTSIILASKKNEAWLVIFSSFFISIILSTSVELIQLLLPSRISNLTDIICNGIGGGLGGILFYFKTRIVGFISAIVTGNIRQIERRTILLLIFAYGSIISLATIALLFSVNLGNWNDDYYLAIGNEVTGFRPWNGHIKSFYFSDRSLSSSEIIKSLKHQEHFLERNSDLVTAFVFDKNQQEYQDRTQHLPNLRWKTNTKNSDSAVQSITNKQNYLTFIDDSIATNSRQWLQTRFPATYLNKNMQETNEFSLGLTVASNSINQDGPARIIAVSEGIYGQNIVLGQEKADLNFRLRTPITGRNATSPEFVVPNVFSDRLFHTILITWCDRKLSFYIDRFNNKYSFTFRPDNSFLVFVPWNRPRWLLDLGNASLIKYKVAFYSIIVVPFFSLAAILIWKLTTEKQ